MEKFQFKLEQVAISVAPKFRETAFKLLAELGMTDWAHDLVVAQGSVGADAGQTNVGALAFNYQAGDIGKPVEFEVLQYQAGENFVDRAKSITDSAAITTHFGMHVDEVQLSIVRRIMSRYSIRTSQEVETVSHTNPVIRDSRRYKYVIFATRDLLGIDLKFIVRKELPTAA